MNLDHTRLPIPKVCDVCNFPEVTYTTNDIIYGKTYGHWPYCYHCKACGAMVGCHPNTNYPLGRMANSKTRRLRKTVHESFDLIWRKQYLTRKEAYNRLASFLNISFGECHISWLSDDQLIEAKLWAIDFVKNNPKLLKRKQKKYAEELNRRVRDSRQAKRRKAERRARFSRSSKED